MPVAPPFSCLTSRDLLIHLRVAAAPWQSPRRLAVRSPGLRVDPPGWRGGSSSPMWSSARCTKRSARSAFGGGPCSRRQGRASPLIVWRGPERGRRRSAAYSYLGRWRGWRLKQPGLLGPSGVVETDRSRHLRRSGAIPALRSPQHREDSGPGSTYSTQTTKAPIPVPKPKPKKRRTPMTPQGRRCLRAL